MLKITDKKEIEEFLGKTPLETVSHLSAYEQYKKVRTKLINEKKTQTNRVSKRLKIEKKWQRIYAGSSSKGRPQAGQYDIYINSCSKGRPKTGHYDIWI